MKEEELKYVLLLLDNQSEFIFEVSYGFISLIILKSVISLMKTQ